VHTQEGGQAYAQAGSWIIPDALPYDRCLVIKHPTGLQSVSVSQAHTTVFFSLPDKSVAACASCEQTCSNNGNGNVEGVVNGIAARAQQHDVCVTNVLLCS